MIIRSSKQSVYCAMIFRPRKRGAHQDRCSLTATMWLLGQLSDMQAGRQSGRQAGSVTATMWLLGQLSDMQAGRQSGRQAV